MNVISTRTAMILLAIASLAVFSVTLQHDFITTWDDDKYVVTNEIIRGFSLQNLRAAFSSFTLGNYAPLHHISCMFDLATPPRPGEISITNNAPVADRERHAFSFRTMFKRFQVRAVATPHP